jgi:tRNA(Ile)-lysidine synthase
MLQQMLSFIYDENLFTKKDKLLLAVSGGADSVVMTELIAEAGFTFAVAHCNFRLRGAEADADEEFVKKLAKNKNVKFFNTSFSTEKYAAENKLSIQMAARELRYRWLEQTRKENNFDCICTAHHLNDIIETVLINLTKGTGIAGMTGIKAKNKKITRPLLFATRQQIEQYAKEYHLKFRTDLSNLSDDYLRNKIRLQVIPVLKEINPSLEKTFEKNINNWKQTEQLARQFIQTAKEKILVISGEEIKINIEELQKFDAQQAILFEILSEYNFSSTVIAQVHESRERQSGKMFLSDTHQLIKHGNFFILKPVEEEVDIEEIEIKNTDAEITFRKGLILISRLCLNNDADREKLNEILRDEKHAALDESSLHFPLVMRCWQAGDYFIPFGMKGKKKKLSDFFTDQKISVDKKRKIKVITSNNEIVWIVGKRVDERYAVGSGTKNVLLMQIINDDEKR